MTDPGPDDDPYTIRPTSTPPEAPPRERPSPNTKQRERSSPPRAGADRPRIDTDTLRRVRRLILISAVASISSPFLPPLGLALGMVAAVLIWRWWSALVTPGLTRLTAAVVVFGAAFALVIGGLGTAVAAIFASEISDYASCSTGANTHRAQNQCREEFDQATEGMVPGWFP